MGSSFGRKERNKSGINQNWTGLENNDAWNGNKNQTWIVHRLENNSTGCGDKIEDKEAESR